MSPAPRGELLLPERPRVRVDGNALGRLHRRAQQRETFSGDVGLDAFVLDPVQDLVPGVNVVESIVGEPLVTRTIEGASTLTVPLLDPDRKILRSGLLEKDHRPGKRPRLRRIDVNVDGLWFRLVKAEKSGDLLTLTFEDREVAGMRALSAPVKVSRQDATRAEFLGYLAHQVRTPRPIRFYSPALHTVQPLADTPKREVRAEQDARRNPGLDRQTRITIKGKPATTGQLANLEIGLSVAERLGAGRKAAKALVLAGIAESRWLNLSGGDRTSTGVLQVLSSTARGTGVDARDVAEVCEEFLRNGYWKYRPKGAIQLEKEHADWTPAQIAQACQGSGVPSAYGLWSDEGDRILEAWGGGAVEGGTVTYRRDYEFTVGRPDGPYGEDYWAAGRRLAEEVDWRLFMVSGTLWYGSEDDLFRSVARMEFDESTEGVEAIDFDWDDGKRVQTLEVTARIDRWAAPPGSVVRSLEPGSAGRWLVAEVERPLFSSLATIRCKLPTPAKPEPLAEQVTETVDPPDDETGSAPGSGKGSFDALLRECFTIDRAGPPYVYGGGHGPALSSLKSGQGLDCSSSVSLALYRAGLYHGTAAMVSGQLASSYGEAGKGRTFTVWAHSGHVWIEFHDAGRWKRFDTSNYGSGGSGPRVRTTERPTTGFTPRHWPGL